MIITIVTMKTVQLQFWITVTLTALTSLPIFCVEAAEDVLLGERSFKKAMEEVRKKFYENTSFTNPQMDFWKSPKRPGKRSREESCTTGTPGATMRAEKVVGFEMEMTMKNFKGEATKRQSKSRETCDIEVKLGWEPTSARNGKGLGCFINVKICYVDIDIQYYAPPNANLSNDDKLCSDDRFATYQFLMVHNHHDQKLGRGQAPFKVWLDTMELSGDVLLPKNRENLDRLFRYQDAHEKSEKYKQSQICEGSKGKAGMVESAKGRFLG